MTSPTPHAAESTWTPPAFAAWAHNADAAIAKYDTEEIPPKDTSDSPADDRPTGWEDGPATATSDGLCHSCHCHPARIAATAYITFLEGECTMPYERMTLRLCYACYRHFVNYAADLEPIECANIDCPSRICQQIKKSALSSF